MSIALDNLGFSAAKASIQYILNPTTTITSLPKPDNLHSVGTLSPPNRRQCQVVGCVHFIASRNRCIGHGGGVRCKVKHCPSGAKHRGLCWSHGGFKHCTVDGCTNRTKARGLCWSHGGGKPCQTPECTKTALRYGHCWAHGGGKRCKQVGCNRPGYARYDQFCREHCV